MAIEITDANFEELVVNSDKPVMIDFWAVWCGPCRMIAPIVEEMSQEYEGKAVIGKVDVDSNPECAIKYGIRNIPTVLFVKNGEVADKQVGAAPKQAFTSKLDAFCKKTHFINKYRTASPTGAVRCIFKISFEKHF
jgi:thioredoxin 1